MFEKGGVRGVWDVYDRDVGVRNVPARNKCPWSLVLRNGTVVTVWPEGCARVTTTSAGVADVESAESVLQKEFGAVWEEEASFREAARSKPQANSYGELGSKAQEREASGFRSAVLSYRL